MTLGGVDEQPVICIYLPETDSIDSIRHGHTAVDPLGPIAAQKFGRDVVVLHICLSPFLSLRAFEFSGSI